MKRIHLVLTVIFAVFVSASCNAQEGQPSKVKWMSVQDAVNQGQKDGKSAKLIFIDCYTSWCGWCKVLDSKTFSNDTVAAILNYYYYPCKFDAEGKETIKIDGLTNNPSTKNGRGATHELMKVVWEGQRGGGYPTMAIRRGNFAPVDCIMGYLGPEELQPALVYYAENYYKQMSFEKFKDKYVKEYQKDVLKKIFKN
ncbi:MAG: DUF255 domain-containing protein [Bacteroidales bacterium]|nr:DUF255 domain-containing protein [Bacteroidales bacterium]